MMGNIADTYYFNDPTLDPLNKILMTFASYNAGPQDCGPPEEGGEGRSESRHR